MKRQRTLVARLATLDGTRIANSLARRHAIRATAHRRAVHPKKIVRAQLPAFLGGRIDDRGPVFLRNAVTLLPLADRPMTLVNVSGHFGQRLPDTKDVADGSDRVRSGSAHGADHARDILSRQGQTTRPMTPLAAHRTIRPTMGAKATTPKEFTQAFCERLKVLRKAARYEEAADFAAELSRISGFPVLPDTYRKYENRTLLPHHLIPFVCQLLEVTIDYLYNIEKREKAHGHAQAADRRRPAGHQRVRNVRD